MLCAPIGHAATVYLATDQTGAQTQIDVSHTSTWLLNATSDFDFGGGLFVMKAGNSATDLVTLTLYQGIDASGSVLASVTLNNTDFCAQVGTCGNFNYHQFLFTAPLSLFSGTSYFAALTSGAPDVQSQAYFIKSDTFFASDINESPINPSPFNGTASSTPEPASFVLLGAGLALLGAARYRRGTSSAK